MYMVFHLWPKIRQTNYRIPALTILQMALVTTALGCSHFMKFQVAYWNDPGVVVEVGMLHREDGILGAPGRGKG